MAKRAKEILGVDKLEVLADKGYYNSVEIKECVEQGIIPYIPEPEPSISKEVDIPQPEFYENKFRYNKEDDVYICPCGNRLTYKNTAIHHNKKMRIYKGFECKSCEEMRVCTRNKNGRIIYRWEYEEVLEEMRRRVKKEWGKVKSRQHLTEHIFGTIKRGFNCGYMLMRGLKKVNGEMGFTVLAYNMKKGNQHSWTNRVDSSDDVVGRFTFLF